MKAAKQNKVHKRVTLLPEDSEYARFYFAHLGYNFQHLVSSRIISKAEYYRRFGPETNLAWKQIPFCPCGGWQNEEEKVKHLEQVKALKRAIKFI